MIITIIELTSKEQEFVAQYFETVIFTEDGTDDFEMYGPELDEDFIRESTIDCLAFYSNIQCYLNDDNYAQAAHDFWLTRNGHGTGFWDRPEIYGKHHAKRFTELAESYGEAYASFEGES
jgi:hypothetical protein